MGGASCCRHASHLAEQQEGEETFHIQEGQIEIQRHPGHHRGIVGAHEGIPGSLQQQPLP